jgi:hypothetical protein
MAHHHLSDVKVDPKALLTETIKAFENTSTNVAAAQMRNSLTTLAESVTDAETKKVRLTMVSSENPSADSLRIAV